MDSSRELWIEYTATSAKDEAVAPGDILQGHVFVRKAKPLSVSEIVVNLYGISDTLITRKYVTKAASADFHGRGFLFQRLAIVLEGPCTLPPGEHRFPFTLKVPYVTEPMKENWKLVNKFKELRPFQGASSPPQPLPSSMTVSQNQSFGLCSASVEYHLDVRVEKGPGASLFSSTLQLPTMIHLTAPRPEPDMSQACRNVATTRHDLGSGAFALHLDCTHDMIQGEKVPVYLRGEGRDDVVLEAITISVDAEIAIRGFSPLWPEKHTTAKRSYQISQWSGGRLPLSSKPIQVEPRHPVRRDIIVGFTSLAAACSKHTFTVAYTICATGEDKRILGRFENIPVRVLGWRAWRDPRGQLGNVGHADNAFNSPVLTAEQYKERKKQKGRK